MRRLWAVLVVVLMMFFGNASASRHQSDAGKIGLREEVVAHLPFKLHRGFAIVVRGSIGNARNLNFLLDTGASPSVVDRRVAQKLHLQVSSGQLSTFTQKVAVDQSVAADIHLGPFHADQLRVLVHDLSVLEETLGVRVDAMVGYDFLQQGPFTIDYPSRKILFGPVDSQLETIPYADGLPYVVVRMHVQNAELPLLVDTGSHDLIVFENVLEGIGPKSSGKQSRTWTNLGGTIQVRPVDFSHSFLGAMPWSYREAFVLQDSRPTDSSGFRGLLGVAALRTARVGFDPVRRLFAWESKTPQLASAELH